MNTHTQTQTYPIILLWDIHISFYFKNETPFYPNDKTEQLTQSVLFGSPACLISTPIPHKMLSSRYLLTYLIIFHLSK